jgi:hypothetical protein
MQQPNFDVPSCKGPAGILFLSVKFLADCFDAFATSKIMYQFYSPGRVAYWDPSRAPNFRSIPVSG